MSTFLTPLLQLVKRWLELEAWVIVIITSWIIYNYHFPTYWSRVRFHLIYTDRSTSGELTAAFFWLQHNFFSHKLNLGPIRCVTLYSYLIGCLQYIALDIILNNQSVSYISNLNSVSKFLINLLSSFSRNSRNRVIWVTFDSSGLGTDKNERYDLNTVKIPGRKIGTI